MWLALSYDTCAQEMGDSFNVLQCLRILGRHWPLLSASSHEKKKWEHALRLLKENRQLGPYTASLRHVRVDPWLGNQNRVDCPLSTSKFETTGQQVMC